MSEALVIAERSSQLATNVSVLAINRVSINCA